MLHLAKELGPKRIRVNMVVPTWMWGPRSRPTCAGRRRPGTLPPDQVIGEITANMPLGEIPADEDVAEAVAVLLLPDPLAR